MGHTGRLFVYLLMLAVAACATPNQRRADYRHVAGIGHLALGDWAGAEEKFDLAISENQDVRREHVLVAFDCRWMRSGCEVYEGSLQHTLETLDSLVAFTKQLRAYARLQQGKWSGAKADADDALRVDARLTIALYVAARIDHRRRDSEAVRRNIARLRANNDPLSVRLAEVLAKDLVSVSDSESPVATRAIRDAAYMNLASMGFRPVASEEIQHRVLTEYDGRIRYELFLPPGWHQPPPDKHGKWGVVLTHESDPETFYGEFRVRLLHPAFGYDPAWYPDFWTYISKNQNPGVASSLRLKPYPGLSLPPGWEARVSGFMGGDDRGRTIWIGGRQQDIVFMYMIHVNPYSATAPKDPDKLLQRYRSDIEKMVAKTRIEVKP